MPTMLSSGLFLWFLLPTLIAFPETVTEALTLEDLYHPDSRIDLDRIEVEKRIWMPDSKHYLEVITSGPDRVVEARTGTKEDLYDLESLQGALESLETVSEEQARKISLRTESYTANFKSFVLNSGTDLFHYDLESKKARRLTHSEIVEQDPELSPSGRYLAFTRENDLFCFDLEKGSELRMTHDGSSDIFNGRLDWVYQEEIYGRGQFRGFWWSPDSAHLVFLRLDDTEVPRFPVVNDLSNQPELESTHYPKAGDPNPIPSLGVVRASDNTLHWVDLSSYGTDEILIVKVSWGPGSKKVYFQVQDREQRWLDLNCYNLESHKTGRLFREESEAWVDVLGEPVWLSDGSFLWQSERTGFRHLYLYSENGNLRKAVTGGEWEIKSVDALDESRSIVFVSGTKDIWTESHLFKVKISSGHAERVSATPGTHSVKFNSESTLYIDSWSDIETPVQIRLHQSEGREVRVLEENRTPELSEFTLAKPQFLQVPTRDGFMMEAMILKPPDFDPNRKYPVLMVTYGGPNRPRVKNRWQGRRGMWLRLMAQEGYIVWSCDNRTASGKGARTSWDVYRNFGQLELRDIEDGISWLKRNRWIDPDRIGIAGWSFGGYLAAYALTHSETFRIGIAGSPVTDWYLYDSVYTERYMAKPQNNRGGYESSSVLKAVKNLSGKLLVIHGLIDDNVHPQNTVQLVRELQRVGKQFELMLYPGARHGIRDLWQVYHLRSMMTRFILENL